MLKTTWRFKNKPDKILTKCEMLGVCQCQKDNVICNTKLMRKDNQSKYKAEK